MYIQPIYDYHNPKLYKPLMKKLLSSLSSDWYDSCYGNDLTASASRNISDDHVMTVYFPNSDIYDFDKELFNRFELCQNIFTSKDSISLETIEEVIEKIKEIEK